MAGNSQKISRETFDLMVRDLETHVEDGVDVLADYSGRGMYGAQCLAVVGDNYVLEMFLDTCLYYGVDARLGNMGQDSMGLSSVFYWPSIEVGEEED